MNTFQSPDQWGGYCGRVQAGRSNRAQGSSFNPLTNGADIVGNHTQTSTHTKHTFQSPDQWGGYCGLQGTRMRESNLREFQSPDQWGGYCGFL